jgi:type I restriction enzyme S subunit
LGAEHLDGIGGFLLNEPKLVPRDHFDRMSTGRVRLNDILIVKDGATTGKVSFVGDNFPFDEAAINEHVFRLVTDATRANPKYVFWYLASPAGNLQVMNDFRGATVGGIARTFVEKVTLPLPPLDEQRRIAGILDKADALRRTRKRAITLLDGLTQSIFLEMFGDPLTNPRGWARKSIKDVCDVVTGNTPSRANAEFYGSEIEWIKSDNISSRQLYATSATESLSKKGKKQARLAPAGSTLITCIAGSQNSIGNAAMTDRLVAFNQQINALIPRVVDPMFIYAQIRVGKRLVQDASTGGMKGLVSKSRLQSIKVMLPPIERQREFSRKLQMAATLKSKANTQLHELETNFASLQHRAFSGQL